MANVYLAGPINGLTYEEATEWRDTASTWLSRAGIRAVSPMRGKGWFKTERLIEAKQYREHPFFTDKGIVARDRFDVSQADILLVNFIGAPKVSVGTAVEIGWANAWDIPIVVAMDDNSPYDHPFVRELAGFIVPTLSEALDIVCRIIR